MATLRVVEIFDSLQGEGYWTGVAMTFVRLAGCNAPALGLECVRWCDTPDSWEPGAGEEMDVDAIMRCVHLPRLCLTGGEPLLQVDGVVEVVEKAHRQGTRVHLETNGTLEPPTPPVSGPGHLEGARTSFDWVVVSPKPPAYFVDPGWQGLVDELKVVIDERVDVAAAAAERLAAAHPGALVSIQPEYGAGRTSVDQAVALVMSHPEWRLSLQIHKLLGVR